MIKDRKSMLRRMLSPARAATLVGMAIVTFGVGTGTANADVVKVPDVYVTKTTAQGTKLEIKQEGQWVNSVLPLNGTPFDRDVFFGGNTNVKASGGSVPVSGGSIETGIQVGYQVDVSNGLSLNFETRLIPQASLSIPAPLGPLQGANPNNGLPNGLIINPGSLVQLPNSLGPLNFSLTNLNDFVGQVPIRPGQIVTIPLNKKAMSGPNGNVNLDNVHFQVNGVGGAFSVRTYSQWTAANKNGDDMFAAYGDPVIIQ